MKYFIYKLTSEKDLVGGGPRKKTVPAIFIAYRFDSIQSTNFKADFSAALKRTKSLAEIRVLDGHVSVGERWPTKARERLNQARLVIVDFSDLSKEVLFECGFAWGLGRTILPVTASPDQRSNVPHWLEDLQCGFYSDDDGMNRLIDSVALHIKTKSKQVPPMRSDSANPSSVFVISDKDQPNGTHDLVHTACSEWNLNPPTIIKNAESLDALENAPMHASLLVADLTGGRSDALVHFCSGVTMAKPTSGVAKPRFSKRVILILPHLINMREIVASSAINLAQVRPITKDQLASELQEHGKQYMRWCQNHRQAMES